MLAISINGYIAATPATLHNTKENHIHIHHNATPSQVTTITLPGGYNQAVGQAKYSNEWWVDVESVDDYDAADKSRISAILEKKSSLNPFVRGMCFADKDSDTTFLAVTLESYIFLIYTISKSVDGSVNATLLTVVGFPRHLGLVTTTHYNNSKYFLITDTMGDVYALTLESCTTDLPNDEKITPKLLYSHVTTITLLESFTAQKDAQSSPQNFLLAADSEYKIRVSNLPNFFDIQSFCMGNRNIPTAIAHIPTKDIDHSPFLFTATPAGFERNISNDNKSGWKAYSPFTTSYTLHNIFTGDLLVKPTIVSNELSFATAKSNIHAASSSFYSGFGVITDQTTKITTLYASPSNVRTNLDQNGNGNPLHPVVTRTPLNTLVKYVIDPETCLITMSEGVHIANMSDFTEKINLEQDLVQCIQANKIFNNSFYIYTVTEKLILVEQNDAGQLVIINVVCPGLIFTTEQLKELEFSHTTIQSTISRNVNYHYRFQRHGDENKNSRLEEKKAANDKRENQTKKKQKTTTTTNGGDKLVCLDDTVTSVADETTTTTE